MPEQIYIGNFAKGLKTDRLPFNIDNDAFPTMYNFYSWRGRAKRKRGTEALARLQRQIISVAVPNFAISPWQFGPLALVAGAGNLKTGPWITFNSLTYTLEVDSSIVPGSISFVVGANTYTEPAIPDGTLIGTPAGSGTINYATGAVTITAGGVGPLTGTFSYYPALPVLGLEDFIPNALSANFPLLLAFDPTYSYQINQTVEPPFFYSTSYYKGTNTPVIWTNDDAFLFWTTNYQSAFWATNNKPGFHFKSINTVAQVSPTRVTITITAHGLIVGDHIWVNEVTGTIATSSGSTQNQNINGQTGRVFAVVDANTITVDFDGTNGTSTANFQPGAVGAGGIAQYLTSSIAGQDGIRWYDGDPTSGTGIPTGTGLGWSNFSPPLTNATVSINDQLSAKYYLVGALAIVPFKDRLLFFGPQIQAVGGVVIQKPLQDTVIWSWNGTPYYTALVPTNSSNSESYDFTAYYVDQTGKGGYQSAGISIPIQTVNNNEDVLLVGFGAEGKKTRFVYTGNDLQPFIFYLINNELPSSSTFSSVSMDRGAIDIGSLGITITTQQNCDRVDTDIPDYVFQIKALNNGQKRVNAIRDFFREWIYFAYPDGNSRWKYPTQTFLLNYRDNTWAILYENFTRHGNYRKQTKNTWKTIGIKFGTWSNWREPWNAGSSNPVFPSIVAGNPQGYVLIKSQGTNEAPSGDINAVANDGLGFTNITSFNHCVRIGDYLYFLSALGLTGLNGKIGKVIRVANADVFTVDIAVPTGTYLGLGTFTRLSQPLLQTKQFPFFWNEGRKTRLGVQKYLFDFTARSQVTINVNLSQDPDNIYNAGPIVPDDDATNKSLIYSQTVYTCPESTNIGLTPANTNLQMPTAEGQYQIWHRMNTSLIGDSVQIGVTLNDAQMRNLEYATSEIALHGIQLTVDRGPQLA